MVLKRQTIWLLTMLSLMVVLSAYYLFNNEPANMNDYAVDWEQDSALESLGDVTSDFDVQVEFVTSESPVDAILAQQYDREVSRAIQKSEYEAIIKSDASTEEIAEAIEKKEMLEDITESEYTIESILRAAGYEEAVVVAESNYVDVVVRSDSLEPKQVIEIIDIVKEQLQVPGNTIHVTYK